MSNEIAKFIKEGSSRRGPIKVEDLFDNNLIPTTGVVGILSSFLYGIIDIFSGQIFSGIIVMITGIMGTIGICIFLMGISTIIQLLRRIADK